MEVDVIFSRNPMTLDEAAASLEAPPGETRRSRFPVEVLPW